MARWICEVTVTEHRRIANIEAETKSEAIRKLRNAEWEDLDDAKKVTFTKSGKMRKDE